MTEVDPCRLSFPGLLPAVFDHGEALSSEYRAERREEPSLSFCFSLQQELCPLWLQLLLHRSIFASSLPLVSLAAGPRCITSPSGPSILLSYLTLPYLAFQLFHHLCKYFPELSSLCLPGLTLSHTVFKFINFRNASLPTTLQCLKLISFPLQWNIRCKMQIILEMLQIALYIECGFSSRKQSVYIWYRKRSMMLWGGVPGALKRVTKRKSSHEGVRKRKGNILKINFKNLPRASHRMTPWFFTNTWKNATQKIEVSHPKGLWTIRQPRGES